MSMLSYRNGEIGEYICALRLLKIGVSCRIINMDKTDIIAEDNGRLFRIQVKSSMLKSKGNHTNAKGYQFNVAAGNDNKIPLSYETIDIMAFVAIEKEQVFFVPAPTCKKQKTRRFSSHKFCEEITMTSWMNCMSYYNNSG